MSSARCVLERAAVLAALVIAGCGGVKTAVTTSSSAMLAHSTPSVSVSEEHTRRGLERDFTSSAMFGAPRGPKFEDMIPVGARITQVNVDRGETINGIWLTVEHGGHVNETPLRGGRGGRLETFALDDNEKIVGIHGYGQGGLDELVVATNRRVVSFGSSTQRRDGDPPPCVRLTRDEKRRYVGIGIAGRADDKLRQIGLRIQIRQPD